jgi:capsular exopolysaccharide synthesis family protein
MKRDQGGGNGDNDFWWALSVLRHHYRLILLLTLLGAAAAFGASALQTKEYTASASLLFRKTYYAESLFGNSVAPVTQDPTREAATNERLVGLRVVAVDTAHKFPEYTSEQIANMVSVSTAGESEIVSISATASDPEKAREIANTFARRFIHVRAKAEKSKLIEAKRLAEGEYNRLSLTERNGVRGRALARASERLGVLASLQTGDAELVQPAETPVSPSSPKTRRNTIIGFLLGLALGILGAFLRERLDRQIRSADEAKLLLGAPLLGIVPESAGFNARRGEPLSNKQSADHFQVTEAFRMLRSGLRYFDIDRRLTVLAVCSEDVGVGKSTVAWNLATVAAQDSRTVLVECDLRNPTLARRHGLRLIPGLTEALTDREKAEPTFQSHVVSNIGGIDQALDVIVSGSVPPNPTELLESQALQGIINRLRDEYDLVILDTAPIGVVPDAFPLVRTVDGVIIVTRIGVSSKDSLAVLGEQLSQLGAQVLGVVANGVRLRKNKTYGYGAYGVQAAHSREDAVAPVASQDH